MAGNLVRVELYTNGDYTTPTKAAYNGDGERLRLTTWAQGVPLTVTFAVFEGQLLASNDDSQTTLYLYGRRLVAEYKGGWAYPLRDRDGSVRQIADGSGAVTLARAYKPLGGILQEQGPYESVFGFLGAQLDRISGLLYADGRYYDPATGRFLTPQRRFDPYHPRSLNPYVPWIDPTLLLLAPLMIWATLKGDKRRRRYGRWMLVLLLVWVAVSVMGCGEVTPTPEKTPIPPTKPTPSPGTPTDTPPAKQPPSPSPAPPSPSPPTPPMPLTPCPPPPPDNNLFRITNEEVNAAGGMLNYLNSEDEALVLARVGMGEGDHQNPTDREYVMWTVKVRATVGLSNNLISPTSVKQEALAQKPDGSYEYLVIEELIAYSYPAAITDCGSNIKRMGHPCDQDLTAFRDTYNQAQTIVASNIQAMPPALRGFDSFVGKGDGSEDRSGKYCTWGQFKEGYNRRSEQLVGGSYFMDCVLVDNYLLGLIDEIP